MGLKFNLMYGLLYFSLMRSSYPRWRNVANFYNLYWCLSSTFTKKGLALEGHSYTSKINIEGVTNLNMFCHRPNIDIVQGERFFQQVVDKFGYETKELLRSWSKLRQDLSDSNARLSFLIQCRQNNVFPNNVMSSIRNQLHTTFHSNLVKLNFSNFMKKLN